MSQRLAPVILILLLAILHAQLWFGRGSVPNVARMLTELDTQRQKNEQARQVNQRLAAEVRDLQSGLQMVEEKARLELGMVKPNEVFVQINRK